jgi:hypothetical protein
MHLREIKRMIQEYGEEAWYPSGQNDVYVFENDVNLRLVGPYALERSHEFPDGVNYTRNSGEKWATAFPDPNAKGITYLLFYNDTCIEAFYYVYLDGGRALLPIPKSPTELQITPWQDTMARIINTVQKLDYVKYFALANFSIKEKE